jgi:hypothetical protein
MTFSINPQPSECGFGIADFGFTKSQFRFFHNPQSEISNPQLSGRPTGDRDPIHGELVTFTDPKRDLPPIDRLEGFRPGGHSMYQRVIVAVLYGRTSVPAWTYWMPRIDTGFRLGSGVWHRPC